MSVLVDMSVWIILPALPVLQRYYPVLTGLAVSVLVLADTDHLFPNSGVSPKNWTPTYLKPE